ncbi:MAG: SMP-30/gluconolactonase/LRE family protein [Kofleriaceae bacterium]|nr:SMP-30/gluconolactonase/LRE family protein [Kofleriaceae bacterium]
MTVHNSKKLERRGFIGVARSALLLVGTIGLVTACEGGSGDSPNNGDGGSTIDGGSTTSDAGPSDAAATRPDASPPSAACDNLPDLPIAVTASAWRPSEDFTFDKKGNLWGVSVKDLALHRIRKDGTRSVILPNVSSWGRGIRFLPSGDLVVAEPDDGSLLRITVEGTSSVVLGNVADPNGIAIHPNGMVYLTSGGGILYRIDPDTGANTHIVSNGPSLDGISFSRDYRTLYYNTEGGTVFSMPVDSDGIPEGAGQVYVTLPKIEILDGMAVDDCNNLYVVEMSGIVWRVTPGKVIEKAVELEPGIGFICALNFGSGVGGWDANTLYIMDLGGQIYAAPIGIGGAP